MNDVIYRYELQHPISEIKIPKDATVLSCGWWKGGVCVWAKHRVNPDHPSQFHTRRFQIWGTGHEHEMISNARLIGLVLIPESGLVFHIFEAADSDTGSEGTR